jgi:multidrug transporter EmrE-like cation transporter
MNQILLIILSVFLGSIGQVALKIGANKISKIDIIANSLFVDLLRIIRTPEIFIGFIFFGISFLLWIKVLAKSELSLVYPMVSLGYIHVALLSALLFQEALTFNKIAGIGIIICGVLIINK